MNGSNLVPVLCLVGAGSNPSLLTPQLTNDLLAWDGFREPSASAPFWGAVGYGEDDQRVPFFTWLAQCIDQATSKANDLNFEDLIHILEMVASQGLFDRDKRWFASDYGAGLLALNTVGMTVASLNPRFIAEQACYYILQRVAERTRDVRDLDAALLLQSFHQKGYRLRTFSLNYDSLVVANLPKPLWTGFQPAVTAESQFLLAPVYPVDQDLHIQLHGSIHFRLLPNDFDPTTRIRRWDDTSGSIAPFEMTSASLRDRYLDGHTAPALPMITGRRKADRILTEPFSSYFHYFRQAAFTTPNWLILGYSGSDPHVNSILESARHYHGSQLRIGICNWLPWNETDGTSWTQIGLGWPLAPRILGLNGFATPFVDQPAFYQHRHATRVLPCISRDDANVLSSEVIATVNGRYKEHAAKLDYWFRDVRLSDRKL
jgi:hypothetical protein